MAERRFTTTFREEASDEAGLVLNDSDEVEVVAADGSRSPLGGSSSFSGFRVYINGGDFAGIDFDASSHVPFDQTDYDSDSYWQVDLKHGIVPAGKAGVYAVSLFLYINDDTGLADIQAILSSGSPSNDWENGFDFNFVKTVQGGSSVWNGSTTYYGRFAEGDSIHVDLGWTYPAGPPTLHLGAASYLSAVLLGDLPT